MPSTNTHLYHNTKHSLVLADLRLHLSPGSLVTARVQAANL